MSSIIKNVAVLALISNSVGAHKINQSANIGVRFIEQPKPDDSLNVMIQEAPQKSAQDKLFDQMEKEEDDQDFQHSLEQTKSSAKTALNGAAASYDDNKAYRTFVDDKFKAPEEPKVAVVEVKKVQAQAPKPTVGHFKEEVQLSQAEQEKITMQNLVQSAKKRSGGDTSDPDYQLAIADATKQQDSQLVDKQLSKIDTDDENDAAIKKSIDNITTADEKDVMVQKDAQKYSDLRYMADHGDKEEKLIAQKELNEQNETQIMGDSTRVIFDPNTATMHVQNSNKPMLNNLAEHNNNMEVNNNVPKAIMAPEHYGQMSAVQANIFKYAEGAYPKDTVTEIDE